MCRGSEISVADRRLDFGMLRPALVDDAFVQQVVAVPRVAEHLRELFLPAGALGLIQSHAENEIAGRIMPFEA